VAAGDVRILLNVDANDKVSAVIKETNVIMKRFGQTAKNSGIQGSKAMLRINTVVKQAQLRFTELNSKVLLAQSAMAAFQRLTETAVSGETAQNAEVLFKQIAGGAVQARKVMENLRKASRGILDDTVIQQFAGSMRIAGVEFDEVSRMLQLAQQIHLVTGEDIIAMTQKLKAAALEGSQGEFEKLGVTVNVNDELRKRAEAEGFLLEEMTKQQQVTERMNILQEHLQRTMAASGASTEELSTSMRSLMTDMRNAVSAGEVSLAQMMGTEHAEKELSRIKGIVERATESASHAAAQGFQGASGAIFKKIAHEVGISEEKVAEAYGKLEEHEKASDMRLHYTAKRILPMLLEEQNRVREQNQKNALEELAEIEKGKKSKADQIKDLIAQNQTLEKNLIQFKANEQEAEVILAEKKISINELTIERLKGLALDLYEHRLALINSEADADLKAVKDAGAEKSKEEKKQAAERRKQRAKDARDRLEKAEELKRKLGKMDLDANQIRLRMESDAARRAGDIEAAQSIERQALQKRRQREFMLSDMENAEEHKLFRAKFDQEEIELAVRHAEELLEIETDRNEKSAQMAEAHRDRMKEMREAELEAFQMQAEGVANALGMLQAPLTQLIDHEYGASEGLKAFGATMGATSAAVDTYTNSTDASADAQDRLVQGLPQMVSAGGVAAASFVKQTKTKALIQGGFESASSLAAFATGNIVAGAGHAAAAAAFFALAGKSGGKGGAGAVGSKTGALKSGGGGTGLTAAGGGSSVTVNVQGFALGSAVDMGSAIGRTVDTARHTGLGTSEV